MTVLLTGGFMIPTLATHQARHQATVWHETQRPVTTHCAATPLQTGPFHRRDVRTLPWITAVPASVMMTGHLFFATLPGTRFVRVGAHGTAAALYTNGAMPGGDNAPMKILWVFENPRSSGVLSPLTITGRNLSGRGTTHHVFPRSGTADYPSIIALPTPGCWQLTLTIKSLAADATTFRAVATMIVIK